MQKYPNAPKVTEKGRDHEAFDAIYEDKISLSAFFPNAELTIESTEFLDGIVNIYARGSLDYGICPYCGTKSMKVHSRYIRHISDLPVFGNTAILHLRMRKFFCSNPECKFCTFAEQPGIEVFRYRRRTRRCEVVQNQHAVKHSSITAGKILSLQGIKLSGSTILRDLHRMLPPAYTDVIRIGVDDWAQRKGSTYGSIIIDLNQSIVIDLLGDREQDSFGIWLEHHQAVELASRDRSTEYSAAISASKYHIIEVADKFHLIKNIQDRFTKVISEHYSEYRSMVRNQEHIVGCLGIEPDIPKEPIPRMPKKQDSRGVMFNEVKELQKKGFKPFAISKKLCISRQTATKYCSIDTLLERRSKLRNGYHVFDRYVEEEVEKGKPLSAIYAEIKKQGFKGSRTPFYDHYRYLSDGHRGFRAKSYKPQKKEKPKDERSALIPVKTMTSIACNSMVGREPSEEGKNMMELLNETDWFNQMYEAACSFYKVIKGNEPMNLIRWMKAYWKTKIPHLKTFIKGIKLDYAAVKNTIIQNVTNGITEGFVNKLKTVKRLMYGKASIGLLKNKMIMEHILFN